MMSERRARGLCLPPAIHPPLLHGTSSGNSDAEWGSIVAGDDEIMNVGARTVLQQPTACDGAVAPLGIHRLMLNLRNDASAA